MSLLLLNLGVVVNRQGKDKEAEAFYQEGMILARQLEHRERISLFLLNLGDLAVEQGQDAQAQSYFQEGLVLARQLAHRERISDLLLHLSMLAIKQSELALAGNYLQEGLALARQLDHPQLICRLLAAWGELHLQQQDIDTAESAFLEMLDLVPNGGRAIVAHAQYGLASVAASRGQLNKARTLAQRSYATFELLGHRKKHTVGAFLAQITRAQQDT
jgi:tetratricopeptide (TPR) repeat protein